MKDKKMCGENTCGGCEAHSSCGTGCGCGGWCAGTHKHGLLRIALLIAIVVIVFSMGVRIGEFKGEFSRGYGYSRHGMMQQGYYYGGAATDQNAVYDIPANQ